MKGFRCNHEDYHKNVATLRRLQRVMHRWTGNAMVAAVLEWVNNKADASRRGALMAHGMKMLGRVLGQWRHDKLRHAVKSMHHVYMADMADKSTWKAHGSFRVTRQAHRNASRATSLVDWVILRQSPDFRRQPRSSSWLPSRGPRWTMRRRGWCRASCRRSCSERWVLRMPRSSHQPRTTMMPWHSSRCAA